MSVFAKEPYEIAIQDCIAACKDAVARVDGCSEYERRLRMLGPVFYNNDATYREIMIKLEVLNHRASLPWWAR